MPPTSTGLSSKGMISPKSPLKGGRTSGLAGRTQITNIFPNLTVLENIRLGAQAMGKDNFKMFHRADSFRQYIDRAEEVIELSVWKAGN